MGQASVIRTLVKVCDLCGDSHLSMQCQEGNPFMLSQPKQSHYLGNQNYYNDLSSNTYN